MNLYSAIAFISRFLFLLCLNTVIFHDQSRSNGKQTRYRNIYGPMNFNTTPADNVLGVGIGALNFAFRDQLYQENGQPDVTPQPGSRYDFIVVGAGTAGAAIAARLSEIKDFSVLLIEAGAEETLYMDIPLLTSFLQAVDDINWKYETEPSDNYCTGMQGKRCKWPRGKVMGGSSVLNHMIATRGNAWDYDRWAELGNEGWAFKDVLKYFKKSENVQIPEARKDRAYRGTNGPVSLDHAPFRTPLLNAFLEGGQELGYNLVDYNGKEQMGFSQIQGSLYRGYRMSSNRAYLHNRRIRNLHVSKKSMVHKVLIDRARKQATGVEFVKHGQRIRVYANKEVILSAGAIGSPQLLMLSGIGPAEHLKKMGIDVIKDARVGDNLMDHIAYGGLTFTVNQPVSIAVFEVLDISQPYMRDFFLEGRGPLTISGGCEGIAFLDVDNPDKKHGLPNMELISLASSIYAIQASLENFGLNQEIRDKFKWLQGTYSWGVFPMILRPKSHGWLRLKSKDPNVKPQITANYMSHPDDVRVLVKGIRAAIKVSETKAMRNLGVKLLNRTVSRCEKYPFDSDDYWECNLRSVTLTIYHYSGTCKMGPLTDKTAVVDPTLKVIGIKGLRVGDASIMPEIPTGHTNIPAFMIAEKLADMIKQEWGYPTDKIF